MRISTSVRSRSARLGTQVATAVAVAGAALAAGAPAAFALGESGDIDVRSVSWHSRGDREGVEVCKFVLVANNFDALPFVTWTITEQPPTVPPGDTLTASLPLIQGKARSQEYLLPEGTYQLTWTAGAAPLKSKSFEVDCSRPAQGGGQNGNREDDGGRGSSESGTQADNSSEKGAEKSTNEIYEKPSGAVPAGGGGVPDMESVSSEGESNVGTSAALVAGAAGLAGLIMVRRTARRRARNEA
ncbi:hypothetical protein C5F59_008985 [Streptomyces sp. QL37]|uniref:hypothetical protein n=1 Tax=Streptomyces sp. QL37 TaxID=2093747 RepID=UPI000CF1D1ED|nr:hypothetical protein [Streptomyces sp. QL37]PPQ56808.1 hypothetical protein C5F59_09080 [Streptomyces sp. QL37]